MSEATGAAVGLAEVLHEAQLRPHDRRDDQLCDAVPRAHPRFFLSEIDNDDVELAAIIRIDRSWRIEHGQPIARCEARTRAHLALESVGDFQRDADGNDAALAGRDANRLDHGRVKVGARGTRRHIRREPCFMAQFLDLYCGVHWRRLWTTSGVWPSASLRDK